MHVQDRGNVALPTDIVKVLKSQDANYIRTMRTTNAKVRTQLLHPYVYHIHACRQKIDKLKIQLSTLADLVKPLAEGDEQDALDEEE